MRNKFALIGHHLSIDLLYKNRPELKGTPLSEIKAILQEMPPLKVTDLNGVRSDLGGEIEGFGVVVNLLPQQYYELDLEVVLSKVLSAIELAKDLGAGVVVLGAANAIVGNQGEYVAGKINDVAITTGNSYTAASVIEVVKQGAEVMKIDLSKAKVVIIGATGSIGAACSHVLSDLAGDVVLVARNRKRLEQLTEELSQKNRAKIYFAEDKEIKNVVAEADICLTMTSAPFALVDAKDFKAGALVCDVAAPRNVSLESGKLREDVLIVDGGLIKPPGKLQKSGFNIGVPAAHAPACLCEGMILALENRFENYTIGRGISIDKVKEIYDLGKKHGFKLGSFRSFGKPLSREYIAHLAASRK